MQGRGAARRTRCRSWRVLPLPKMVAQRERRRSKRRRARECSLLRFLRWKGSRKHQEGAQRSGEEREQGYGGGDGLPAPESTRNGRGEPNSGEEIPLRACTKQGGKGGEMEMILGALWGNKRCSKWCINRRGISGEDHGRFPLGDEQVTWGMTSYFLFPFLRSEERRVGKECRL